MKIILDTNVITKDYKLQGSRILKLNEAARRLGYEICIPQVVIDEIFHQYRDEIQDAHKQYIKSVRSLSKLGLEVKMMTDNDLVNKTVELKKKEYIERLDTLNIKMLPYPSTQHCDIVEKELEGKKPFCGSQKGYRDSLIWETVKEQLDPLKDLFEETQIFFLSANTHDFANKKKSLHLDLIKEFTDLGFTDNAVKLVSDLDKFFNDTINAELEELETIAESLKTKRRYNRINLDEEIQSLLYDEYVYNDVLLQVDENCGTLLPQTYENPSVQEVNLREINNIVVHRLEDGTAFIDCEVDAVAHIDFCLFRGDYYFIDDDSPITIIESNWNEHYSLAITDVEITAQVSLRVSERFYRVLSKDLFTREVRVAL